MKYIKLLRVKHYVKNALLFLPIFFANELRDVFSFKLTFVGFIVFSLTASVVYIINDVKDIEKDKYHPIKRARPIASGDISVKKAYLIALLLISIIMLLNYLFGLNLKSVAFLCLYLVSNYLYSCFLKNYPLFDISIISLSYILRIFYGASLTNISISNWLILTVIAFSYFIALGKRRNELMKNGSASRKVLNVYNQNFLDKSMYVSETLFIVFYSLWSLSNNQYAQNAHLLVWTVPIVILIVFRYSMILENDSYGDPVDVLLSDKMLLSFVGIYGLFMLFIYFVR